MTKITREQYNKALQICWDYKNQLRLESSLVSDNVHEVTIKHLDVTVDSHITYTDLSVRAINILRSVDVDYVKDLKDFTVRDIRKIRRCGKQTFYEIIEMCNTVGLVLKFDGISG